MFVRARAEHICGAANFAFAVKRGHDYTVRKPLVPAKQGEAEQYDEDVEAELSSALLPAQPTLQLTDASCLQLVQLHALHEIVGLAKPSRNRPAGPPEGRGGAGRRAAASSVQLRTARTCEFICQHTDTLST